MASDGTDPTTQRTNDELSALVTDAIATFEVPSQLAIDRAVGLFALRDFDAELLVLLTDSVEAQAVGLRAERPSWRVLSFHSDGLSVGLELDGSGQRVLTGQIESDSPATVEVISNEGTQEVQVDEFGRFTLVAAPAGPFRVLAVCGEVRHITPILTV